MKDTIRSTYKELNVNRIEADKWNCEQMAQELTEEGMEVSFFSQAIGVISFPTKQFEKLTYEGKIKHDGNPILQWMLSGCVIYRDANDNIKVHKGQSNKGGKRIDGIIAIIMALGGSMSVEEDDGGKYSKPGAEVYI